MADRRTWAKERAAQIRKDANERYGAGWAHLSQDQRENFIAHQVLILVLTQAGEQFAAAQAMAREVMAAIKGREGCGLDGAELADAGG